MEKKDYYKILEIDKFASDKEIRRAYKKLALKWHPDKSSIHNAKEKFSEISEAYDVLSDPQKKEQYDRYGFIDDFIDDEFDEPEDNYNTDTIFRNFSTSNVNETKNTHNVHKIKDPPQLYNMPCTLEDLYNGTTKKIKITRKTIISRTLFDSTKELEMKIYPGFKAGSKFTHCGLGNESLDKKKTPCDIVFEIIQIDHPIYTRDVNNLNAKISISLHDALNGFEKKLILLDKKELVLKIKKLKRSDYTHTISGKGMPIRKNGKFIGYGDLIVNFVIIF